MKRYTGALFLLWTGVIIVAYYVVQKPGLWHSFTGLADTFWTLLVAGLLLFNSYGLGKRTLRLFKFESQEPIDHLLLSLGIGLGVLGLLGLFVSVIQLAHKEILTLLQFSLLIFFLLKNDIQHIRTDFNSLLSRLNLTFSQYNPFTQLTLFSLLTFSFFLTLVPPFEAFDALFYHLTQPAWVLQNGGLRAVDIAPHFWFPNLTENVYLWALGLGSERATQMLHFAWMLLSALLLWHWSAKVWNAEIARKTLLILASMPALPLLASWAYADMALVYYSIAAIYAFAQYCITKGNHWLAVIALMSGFAMSVKYTAFVVPLACGLLLLFHRPILKSISTAAQFSLIAILTALPYYARNAIFMHNPFYPFVLGGLYWDDFRAAWYADSGTGIGWDAIEILLLPINTLLGHHDANFFDGRMGPLFLILAPFTIWVLISRARMQSARDSAQGWSLQAIGVFSLVGFAAWTAGVINSSALWQGRLLFPVLIPFAIPTALAWDSLQTFDTSRLRISFLINALVGIILILTIFDNAIFVLQRNPLAIAIGAQTRQRYIERINPSYAALMSLMEELPADANVYALFEPRTYGLPRPTQPDAIIYNFADDVYRYQTSNDVIAHWRAEGYTHVIVYERGLDFMIEFGESKFTSATQSIFQEIVNKLDLVAQTPDQVYSIYQIP